MEDEPLPARAQLALVGQAKVEPGGELDAGGPAGVNTPGILACFIDDDGARDLGRLSQTERKNRIIQELIPRFTSQVTALSTRITPPVLLIWKPFDGKVSITASSSFSLTFHMNASFHTGSRIVKPPSLATAI